MMANSRYLSDAGRRCGRAKDILRPEADGRHGELSAGNGTGRGLIQVSFVLVAALGAVFMATASGVPGQTSDHCMHGPLGGAASSAHAHPQFSPKPPDADEPRRANPKIGSGPSFEGRLRRLESYPADVLASKTTKSTTKSRRVVLVTDVMCSLGPYPASKRSASAMLDAAHLWNRPNGSDQCRPTSSALLAGGISQRDPLDRAIRNTWHPVAIRPYHPIDINRAIILQGRRQRTIPGRRQSPVHSRNHAGPVAARSVGRAGLGDSQPHTNVGREPLLGSTPVGLSRPSDQHVAGHVVDKPRSPGEHRQASALSIAEGIRIVLPSLTITDRSSPMSSPTVERDGMLSPSRAIKSTEEVVQAIRTVDLYLLQQGFSPTKILRKMADILEPDGELGFLDASSRALAEQTTKLILVTFQLSLIAINGRNMAAVADEGAISDFNRARETTDPSLTRQHLQSAGEMMDISKTVSAIAEQASALTRELDELTSHPGSRLASLPVPPWFQAVLAKAPSADSFRVAVAFAKGQLATWRGLEPSLMRTLTMRRKKAAEPSRTPDSQDSPPVTDDQ